jgi:hypothetical protein
MTIGEHNPFHTKENSYDEPLELFSSDFDDVKIIENSLEPPTPTGRAMREKRWLDGRKGGAVPPEIDTAWLHNTHSFFCFLRGPRKL